MEQLDFPKDEPVIPKRCIFITMTDGNGKQMALTSSLGDKYAPRKTGIYDVGVDEWEGKGSSNQSQ
jgi:hypothetical protein